MSQDTSLVGGSSKLILGVVALYVSLYGLGRPSQLGCGAWVLPSHSPNGSSLAAPNRSFSRYYVDWEDADLLFKVRTFYYGLQVVDELCAEQPWFHDRLNR
eukprot:scaffold1289_cov274-Pinguiococcus_pyrenoidosus.AAC.10